MEGYQIGKDISEIKDRLQRIEDAILHRARKKNCKACKSKEMEVRIDSKSFDPSAEHKSFRATRIDADDCECREQTLVVYPDGKFTHIAVHYNHSQYDDGDTHRLTVHIRAGDEIIHSFETDKFVPNYEVSAGA